MREPLERQYFDECVRPLLGGDVEYLGELNAEEKYRLLGGAFALLNPIQWPEPFGLVMIEALACGTPVIATGCGSAPEIIDDGDTGFVRTKMSALADVLLHRAGDLDRNRCREKDRGGRLLDDAMASRGTIPSDRLLADRVMRRPGVPAKSR